MIDQLTTILVFILLVAFIYKYWLLIIILFIALFIIIYLLC
jgi:hypothetical protein